MSEQTKIEWADCSWNPWEGCTKVSPGCANCYAEARNHRFGLDNWGRGKSRRRTSAANWKKPLKWNRDSEQSPPARLANYLRPDGGKPRPRVFPSLCDWLDEEVPIEWLADFLKLIHDTPNLDWLLLTKRPENFFERMNHIRDSITTVENLIGCEVAMDWRNGHAPHNVWLGVSVENQKCADERIPQLLKIPAKVRFLSVEPMLEAIDLKYATFNGADSFGQMPGIDWVIVGGESGLNARPCNVEWIRDIAAQCKAARVPCFVKQLGGNIVCRNDAGFDGDAGEWPMDTHYTELDPMVYQGAPVRVRLKHSKGGDMAEWPEDLRVREFPNPKEHHEQKQP